MRATLRLHPSCRLMHHILLLTGPEAQQGGWSLPTQLPLETCGQEHQDPPVLAAPSLRRQHCRGPTARLTCQLRQHRVANPDLVVLLLFARLSQKFVRTLTFLLECHMARSVKQVGRCGPNLQQQHSTLRASQKSIVVSLLEASGQVLLIVLCLGHDRSLLVQLEELTQVDLSRQGQTDPSRQGQQIASTEGLADLDQEGMQHLILANHLPDHNPSHDLCGLDARLVSIKPDGVFQ